MGDRLTNQCANNVTFIENNVLKRKYLLTEDSAEPAPIVLIRMLQYNTWQGLLNDRSVPNVLALYNNTPLP